MSKIGLIIKREYITRVCKKSFILMTLLIPFVFAGLAVVPAILAQIKDTQIKQIAVIDRTGLYKDVLKDSANYRFQMVEDEKNQPLSYFENNSKELYAILMIDDNLLKNTQGLTLFSDKTVNQELKNIISKQLNTYLHDVKINSFNIPNLAEIIQESDVKIHINAIKWDEKGDSTQTSSEVATGIGILSTFLIYMFIFAYGGMVMNGVMQEKTNRIVEIIVSSVKPFELMIGKIIGIGLVGLTQFLIWIGLIAILFMGFNMTHLLGPDLSSMDQMGLGISMPEKTEITSNILQIVAGINFIKIIGFFLIYFVGGYLLYASIFAAIGSMVDQEADTQQFMIPVTMIILFAFYVAIYSLQNPDGPLAFWCSLIPFFSPIVMMVRVPYDVPFWEVLLSTILLYGTFILGTFFAGKIYRRGILSYGKKIGYKEMFKWLRS